MPQPHSSLVPLPHRYVVPVGRFREIYYWDSYFTMLGLEQSGRHDLVVDMVQNFAWLIDTFGHVPNGNRSYYLSRSQPPFFAAMVELLAERDGERVYATYLPQLAREYAFWMDGVARLAPGSAYRRVVRLKDGTILNRYWDDRETPREESYREDIETARTSTRPAHEVYRNLRAAAESGWDFSFTLVGGWSFACHDQDCGTAARRSQLSPVSTRAGAGASVSVRERPNCGAPDQRPGMATARGHSAPLVEWRGRGVRGLSLAG